MLPHRQGEEGGDATTQAGEGGRGCYHTGRGRREGMLPHRQEEEGMLPHRQGEERGDTITQAGGGGDATTHHLGLLPHIL